MTKPDQTRQAGALALQPKNGSKYIDDPDYEIVPAKDRSRTEAVGLESGNDAFNGSADLSECFGNLFPDNWLYSEDELVMEFEVRRIDRRTSGNAD
jgi:hypothetical protein